MLVRVQRYPVASSLFEPFEPFAGIGREIEDMFGGLWAAPVSSGVHTYPAVDVAEYENESVVIAEMPGVKKEDLKLSLHDGVLTISGERKAHQVPENSSWLRNETRTGEFSRSIELPHEVKSDAITAELSNGILRVVLPQSEDVGPREIAIK